MANAKTWKALNRKDLPLITVIAETEAEALVMAEEQLNREGRREVYAAWLNGGRKMHLTDAKPNSAQVKQYMQIVSPYEDAIVQAARKLVMTGRRTWEYQTQYASGTTVWRCPEDDHRIMIKYGKEER